jgi:WD40 repeat protein
MSASYDERIIVWDAKTFKIIHEFRGGHNNRIYKVQFSPTKIVSCSLDQTLVIWDFAPGQDGYLFE